MQRLYSKYPAIISALLLIIFSFPDVVLGHASLMVTNAVPFDGTSSYYTHDGKRTAHSFYPEISDNVIQGYFDAGGSLWQSESKLPFMKYAMQNGESPFWNPYQGAGTLGSESLVDIKFSPITMLGALLGGSSFAYNLAIMLFLTLSTFCMIKLCTIYLKLPLIAGIAAAIAFLFNGYQTSGLASNYAQSYMLFPICLYAMFGWVRYGSIGHFIKAYVSCALILCLTFIPTTALTLLAIMILTAGYAMGQPCSIKQKLSRLFSIGGILLSALLLVAAVYFPIFLALTENTELATYSERVYFPVNLNGLLSLFSPKHLWTSYVTMTEVLITQQSNPAYVANNAIFHIGITGGLLSLFAFRREIWKKPVLYFAFIASAFVLLRIFGIALYPHPENSAFVGNFFLRMILFAGVLVGLFSQKKYWKKPQFIPIWIIAGLIILRLFGFDYYSRVVDMLPVIGSFGTQYVWVIVMVCLPICVAYGISNINENPRIMLRTKYFLGFLGIVLFFTLIHFPFNTISNLHIAHLIAFLCFCAAILLLSKLVRRPTECPYIPVLLVLFLFIEYNYYVNHMRPERSDIYNNTPEYVEYIKEHIGNQRIVNIGQSGIPAEQASAYQIQDISTNTNSPPADYANFYDTYLLPKEYRFGLFLTFLQAKDTAQINMKMMSFMGVKYVIVPKEWPVWNAWLTEHLSLAFSTPAIAIYENADVWPRAFVSTAKLEKLIPESIEDNQVSKKNIIPAEITSYHHDNLSISVNSPKEGTLVLTDNWYPYWHARVNDKEVKVEKVFGAFRGVAVPKGKSEVTFFYQNPAVVYGVKVSQVMLIITLILGLIAMTRTRFGRSLRPAEKQS